MAPGMRQAGDTVQGRSACSGCKPTWEGGCVWRADSLGSSCAQEKLSESQYFYPRKAKVCFL